MSSTIDEVACPKCGKTAYREQDNNTCDVDISCSKCGFGSHNSIENKPVKKEKKGKRRLYKIPISWSVSKIVEVKASNLEEALQMVQDDNMESGEYVDSSWEINYDSIPAYNGDTKAINKEVREL